ncbi:MAG: hypothetical protein ACQEUT_11520 [Bacillota bacterium]
MTPLIKYNINLLIIFSVISYFTIGQYFGLPAFLGPVLFILLLFGLIFSVMVGERLKEGLPEHSIWISKMSWTFLYVLVVSMGSFVFGLIPVSTPYTIFPVAAIYLIIIIYKMMSSKKLFAD